MLNYHLPLLFLASSFRLYLPNSLLGRKWWWHHIPLHRWLTAQRATKSSPKFAYGGEFECRHKIISDYEEKNGVWYFVNNRNHEEMKITGNSCHKRLYEFHTILIVYESDGWLDMLWVYVMFVRLDVAWIWCPPFVGWFRNRCVPLIRKPTFLVRDEFCIT